jgi:putative inorganic carbon (hco3(-)) transporter
MGRSVTSSALPRGLRLVRHRRGRSLWLVAVALIGGGVAVGAAAAGAPSLVVMGAIGAVVVIAAAAFNPALGLAGLAFTLPYDQLTHAGPIPLTTSEALIGLLVLVWIVRQVLPNPPALYRTPLDIIVLAFAAVTILTLFGFNSQTQTQLVGILKATGGIVMFFLATQSLQVRKDIWLVIGAVIATGVIQAADTSLGVFSGQTVSIQARANGPVIDANLFGGFLVLVVPMLMAIGLALRRLWVTVATAAATLICTVALAATLSRSSWLGLVAATLVLGIVWPERRRHIAIFVGAVALLVLVVGLAGPIGARLSGSDTGPFAMLANRWDVWKSAVAMTVDHPLFGIGIDNFQNFDSEYGNFGINHAHNLFLNIAAERGIPALLVFGALIFALFRTLASSLRKAQSTMERALIAGFLATFAGYLVHSIFEVSYYDHKVLLLFWLLVGVAASLPRLLSLGSKPIGHDQTKRQLPRAAGRVHAA